MFVDGPAWQRYRMLQAMFGAPDDALGALRRDLTTDEDRQKAVFALSWLGDWFVTAADQEAGEAFTQLWAALQKSNFLRQTATPGLLAHVPPNFSDLEAVVDLIAAKAFAEGRTDLDLLALRRILEREDVRTIYPDHKKASLAARAASDLLALRKAAGKKTLVPSALLYLLSAVGEHLPQTSYQALREAAEDAVRHPRKFNDVDATLFKALGVGSCRVTPWDWLIEVSRTNRSQARRRVGIAAGYALAWAAHREQPPKQVYRYALEMLVSSSPDLRSAGYTILPAASALIQEVLTKAQSVSTSRQYEAVLWLLAAITASEPLDEDSRGAVIAFLADFLSRAGAAKARQVAATLADKAAEPKTPPHAALLLAEAAQAGATARNTRKKGEGWAWYFDEQAARALASASAKQNQEDAYG